MKEISKLNKIIFRLMHGRHPSNSEQKEIDEINITNISISSKIQKINEVVASCKNKNENKIISIDKSINNQRVALLLTTFPYGEPRHGGQHRVSQIAKTFEETAYQVVSSGVLGSQSYIKEKGYINYPGEHKLKKYLDNTFLMEDWCIGQLFEYDDNSYNELASEIHIKPTIIYVEHPWLFGFAERLRITKKWADVPIIYGSANIENTLKYNILKNYCDEDWSRKCKKLVEESELRAARDSDYCICVTNEEQEWIINNSSKEHKRVVICPNGAILPESKNNNEFNIGSLVSNCKYAIFCASAHPPNMSGFWNFFQNGLGCISPNHKLVIVGGVCESIRNDNRFEKTSWLKDRSILLNEVCQKTLNALISNAHLVILPINYGSGTNLKTAEAIMSKKYVVATSVAMRGFEKYQSLNNIKITDEISEFCQYIRDCMSQDVYMPSEHEDEIIQTVSWEHCLIPLKKLIA